MAAKKGKSLLVDQFMRDPTIALRYRRGELKENEIPVEVAVCLKAMLTAAQEIRRHYPHKRLRSETRVLQLVSRLIESKEDMQEFDQQAPSAVYSSFSQSIRQVRSTFHLWANTFMPRPLLQLFTSDGLVDHIEDPALLLLAIFWPEEIPLFIGFHLGQGKQLPRNLELEQLQSAMALRTWLYAVEWLPNRQSLARGNLDVMRMTSWFMLNLFADQPGDRTQRTRPVMFEFNPEKAFTFVRVLKNIPVDSSRVLEVLLSRRYIRVGDRLIRFYYDSGLKSDAASMRRMWFRGNVADLVRCKFVFETDEDFQLVRPIMQELLFDFAVPKVIDGVRVDSKPNDASASMKGWYWTGLVTLPDNLVFEIECQTMERYYNDHFSMTLFNHLVYEVRRLLAPLQTDLRFWETIFPGAMHTELTNELMITMVKRQLRDVLGDCYTRHDHIRDQARTWLDELTSLLHEHPEYLDKPLLEPRLVF